MSGTDHNPKKLEPKKARTLGKTEQNWCRAASCGTGTTVLLLRMAKPPTEIPLLHEVLKRLRQAHPLLRHRLHYNPTTKEFSFVVNSTATSPQSANVEFHDVRTTAQLLHSLSAAKHQSSNLSQCHLILEHELNNETWRDPDSFPRDGIDVVFASLYALSETKSMVVLRLHVSACDRTTAESLLRELMELVAEVEGGRKMAGIKNEGEGNVGIEGLVPSGMGKKTIWGHGMDMLGYSVNSFRLTNLKFGDTKRPRHSQVVRLQMDTHQTAAVLAVSAYTF